MRKGVVCRRLVYFGESKRSFPGSRTYGRQRTILQHIGSNIGYCADEGFKDAGKAQSKAQSSKVPQDASLLLDALNGQLMILRSAQVQYHVRETWELLAGSLEERNTQSGDEEMAEMMA